MTQRLGIGLIGAGIMGRNHARVIQEVGARLVAVFRDIGTVAGDRLEHLGGHAPQLGGVRPEEGVVELAAEAVRKTVCG